MKRLLLTVTLITFTLVGLLAQNSLPDDVLINYSAKNKSLKQILLELSDKSGVNISYNDDIIPEKEIEPFFVRTKRLGLVLKTILEDTDLQYKIVGNELVILKNEYANLDDLFSLSGYLLDKETGERLLFANIYDEYEKSYGVVSNEHGFYSLKIPKGERLVTFSYTGYQKQSINIQMDGDKRLDVELDGRILLNEVVVVEKHIKPNEEVEDLEILPIEKLGSMSSLGGEADILRMAQLQSGISTGSDGFGGLNVRGGSTDHNLILLDGVPVYNAGHALGIFSIFNSSMIKSAKLIKNGFPARYGGRLASVLDIRTRDGSLKGFHGDVNIGTAAVKGTVEGPIIKDKVSFLLSGRRTILDPWIKQGSEFFTENEGSFNYYFYDLNGKLNLKLGNNNKIVIGWYGGQDRFNRDAIDPSTFQTGPLAGKDLEESTANLWKWGNQIGTVRWNSNLGKRLFANLSLHFSKFDFSLFDSSRNKLFTPMEQDTTITFAASLFKSEIKDYGANLDINYLISNNYSLRVGGNAIIHQFNPGIITLNDRDYPDSDNVFLTNRDLEDALQEPNLLGDEYRLYIENEVKLGPLSFNLGAHGSMINTESETYTSLQPRFAMNLKLGDRISLQGGLSYMNQFLHLLTNSGLGLPNDVWLPSTNKIKPQESRQASAGAEIDFGKNLSLGLGGFIKDMKNVISSQEGGIFSIVETKDWEDNIETGTGEAYGAEVDLRRRFGKVNGWVNYTYTKSTRQFENLNQGKVFPASFNRKHSVKLNFLYQVTENAEFTFNWTYGTGLYYSSPDRYLRVNDDRPVLIPLYTELNNAQLPEYHRLDISFNFYNKYSWGQQKMSIGVYNAYNRTNPLFIEVKRSLLDPNDIDTFQTSLFGILPSFSYNLAF